MPPRTNETAFSALAELGFGPDACLMRDPRVFVDARFLGALIVEFADELGDREAARSLFQIGLLHGLRDAQRASGALFEVAEASSNGGFAPQATPLAIRLEGCQADPAGLDLAGHWPEEHEANAWLSRRGPTDSAACHLSSGYTSGWLSGAMEADIFALETACVSCGDDACTFVARELSHWEAAGDTRAEELLGGITLSTYRQVAAATFERELGAMAGLEGPPAFTELAPAPSMGIRIGPRPEMHEEPPAVDVQAPVVHIWGPVMVLPFTSPDEALQAVDLLSRDPSTGEVRTVVLDLRETVLDEAFGAAALEQVLEIIELWGAEALITGVSPLSEAAVADCETRHLLVRKDLSEAIAAAFQIADAQRFSL